MKDAKIVRRAAGASLIVAAILASALPALADDAPKDKGWERTLALGINLTSGNSDSAGFTGSIEAQNIRAQDEVHLGFGIAYSETEGTVAAAKETAHAQYNHLVNDRVYWLVSGDALHDDVADVAYRITVGPGVGYYFIKNDKTKLAGEVGPSVVFEQLQHDTGNVYAAIRFGDKFEHKLSEGARIFQSLDVTPQIDKWQNYKAQLEVGVESALTKSMNLRVVVDDNYDSEPNPGRKHNDVALVGSLAYKF